MIIVETRQISGSDVCQQYPFCLTTPTGQTNRTVSFSQSFNRMIREMRRSKRTGPSEHTPQFIVQKRSVKEKSFHSQTRPAQRTKIAPTTIPTPITEKIGG